MQRLGEVINNDFNSIPVVNMAGKIIGLIPKSSIIVLIENHWWYNESKVARQEEVTSFYQSAIKRTASRGGSMMSYSPKASKNVYQDIDDIIEEVNKEIEDEDKAKVKEGVSKSPSNAREKSEILEYSD